MFIISIIIVTIIMLLLFINELIELFKPRWIKKKGTDYGLSIAVSLRAGTRNIYLRHSTQQILGSPPFSVQGVRIVFFVRV
jgi:hypothetical protein